MKLFELRNTLRERERERENDFLTTINKMPSKPRLNEKLRLAVVALAGSPVFKKIHSTTALFKFLEDIPKISSEMKDKLSIGKTTTFIVQKLLPLRTWHTINKLVKSEIALLLCRVGAHFQNFQKGHASLTGLRDVMHLLEEAETFQRENGMLKNLKSHLQKLASYNFEREVENVPSLSLSFSLISHTCTYVPKHAQTPN